MGYMPLPEKQLSADAVSFVEKTAKLDKFLEETLKAIHLEAEKENAVVPVYVPGQLVWVLRPRKKGADKLDSWWVGPCTVEQRLGETTYMVQTGPSTRREVHASQLRPHHADALGRSWPLFYTSALGGEDSAVEADEYEVEKVVEHKIQKSGDLLFLVKWANYPEEEKTWEKAEAFLPRYCRPWVEYCRKHNLKIDVLKFVGK